MAGGGHHPFRSDPAVERWSTMHATMYQRFRMTPKATRQVLALGVALPAVLYGLSVYGDDKFEFRARTREDNLSRYSAPSQEKSEE
ncbi:uncharacterized protein FA14DRAFT_176482 [Meira miltonrushii]|uniref:NADH dehydrogenase [ubiquinone] 1 beta subcomplex subunit 4 n=1 Tax=Meira miltonrushii TaxID=1280837 RepID=A0A316VHW9_9BASI|nr:uncharacterized protein FA14DRAFT_176482 [Meira miltonrushii]PWN37182.1 hypothetical protein FA14DRAFT_176482 [Meira miltonrushii]